MNNLLPMVLLLALVGQSVAAELPEHPEKLKTEKAVDAYFAVVRDGEQTPVKRNYAAAQIIKLGKPALAKLIQLYEKGTPDERGYLALVLGAMDRTVESEAVLLNDLKKNGLAVHPNVIKALGDLGTGEAAEPLLELLADAPEKLRARILYALGKVADEKATKALWEGADDPDRLVRLACANGIVRLLVRNKSASSDAAGSSSQDRQTRRKEAAKLYDSLLGEVLRYCEKGKSQDVRLVLLRGLGKLNESRAVSTLKWTLTDSSAAVRAQSARTLGQLKADAAVDDLIDVLTDENAGVRHAVLGLSLIHI